MNLKTAKIHIIGGTGQMGNWVKNFFLSKDLSSTVSNRTSGKEFINSVDLVFISVPISQASKVIENTLREVKKETIIIDLSSVMEDAEKILQKSKHPAANIHFLFAPNVSSVQNQKIIVNIIKNNQLISEFIQMMEKDNAHIIQMDAKNHDLQMAHIQSLTHFINLTTAKVCIENNVDLAGKISTPVFMSQIATLNRVVAQDPSLLSEIQLNNSYTLKVIDQLTKYQTEITNLIKQKNKEALTIQFSKLHTKLEPKKIEIKSKTKTEQKVLDLKGSTVAFLGPSGTFSHQALTTLAKNFQPIACSGIYDIYKTVSIGRADFGIVPAENSTEGTVRETFDYLVDFNLYSNCSIEIPIHQNLLSKEKNIKEINKIISHPQALGQTKKWLLKNMPNVKLENASSTLSGLDGLDKKQAIIGPTIAAKIYSLNILASDIADNKDNATIFYLISKSHQNLVDKNKTLLFLTIFNRVGILRDILDVFAGFNMDLSKIESRPTREKVWDYHFFIEVNTRYDDEKLIQALNVLKQYCPVIKVLGST